MSMRHFAIVGLLLGATHSAQAQGTLTLGVRFNVAVPVPEGTLIDRLLRSAFGQNSSENGEDRSEQVAASVTLADVEALSTNGVSDEIILNQIRTTGTTFTLSAKDIILLKKNKVSDRIVLEMQNTRPRKDAPANRMIVVPLANSASPSPPSNLAVAATALNEAQVGEEVPVTITVTNIGKTDLDNVVIRATLSHGLQHPEGDYIQAKLRKIAAGKAVAFDLRARALTPGPNSCSLTATADGASSNPTDVKINIVPSQFKLSIEGPLKAMVKEESIITLEIVNASAEGTAPVTLACILPEGLDMITASDNGVFDVATRTVNWNLGCAPAEYKRQVKVKTKATAPGQLAIRAVAQAGEKLNARAETVIQTEQKPDADTSKQDVMPTVMPKLP
jgi:uncharacterized repeat protein (TIGR01451 family)